MDKVGKSYSQGLVGGIQNAGAEPPSGRANQPRSISVEDRARMGLEAIAGLADFEPSAAQIKAYESPVIRAANETARVLGEASGTTEGILSSKAAGLAQGFFETTEVARQLRADLRENDRTYSRTMKAIVAKVGESLFYGAAGAGCGAVAGAIAGVSAPIFVTAGAAVVVAGVADQLGIFPGLIKDIRAKSQRIASDFIDAISPHNIRETMRSFR